MSRRLIGFAVTGVDLLAIGLMQGAAAFTAEAAYVLWLGALGAVLYWPGWIVSKLIRRPVSLGESLLCSLGAFVLILSVFDVLNSTGVLILDSQEKEYRGECMRLGGEKKQCQKEYYARSEAVSKYTDALATDPGNALHYRNRGNEWYRMRKYDRAIADYTEAIRLDPKDALVFDHLGAAYAEAGNFTEAVRWEEKALANAEFAKENGDLARKRLELYRKQQPYRIR